MTEEERVARAMLLGWRYVPKMGYYIDPDSTYENNGVIHMRYDANTLEPLTFAEVMARDSDKERVQYYADT